SPTVGVKVKWKARSTVSSSSNANPMDELDSTCYAIASLPALPELCTEVEREPAIWLLRRFDDSSTRSDAVIKACCLHRKRAITQNRFWEMTIATMLIMGIVAIDDLSPSLTPSDGRLNHHRQV